MRPKKLSEFAGELRFPVWHRHFPDRIECPTDLFQSADRKTSGSAHFGNGAGVNPGGWPRDKAYPQLRSPYSHAEMLRSIPVRWCLLGLIAARLVQPLLCIFPEEEPAGALGDYLS
jgi:hypothetical protein